MDSDRVLAEADALLRRVAPEGRARIARRRARRRRRLAGTARRLLLVTAAALVGMVAIGWYVPLGTGGIMLFALAVLIAWGAVLLLSAEPETRDARELAAADIAALPARTESWLERQRPMLPAPAVRLVDGIGLRLDALGPQLATLDAREPAAAELRKLIAEELPELIDGYARVPAALRGEARSGLDPERALLDGLAVVDEELGRMSERLAGGDLRRLATQNRYLALKYGEKGSE